MKKSHLIRLLFLALAYMPAQAADYIVDVDARYNHYSAPVRLWLDAGRYELTAIGPSEGGYFIARNAWAGTTTNCSYSIGRCSQGWQHGVSIFSDTGVLSPTQYEESRNRQIFYCAAYEDSVANLKPEGETYLAWESAEAALSSMKTAVASKGGCYFDLSRAGYVDFYDWDLQPADNIGGVSYRISSTNGTDTNQE